jgi:prepilin-type N-terminal cleavage/methylation domain-containing protein/prepilin-type processing-associated H-X9-DG protein
MGQDRGFTLVELLVVIGVVSLLVAILLPVLGAARRTGKTAVCASNLRTLGQATMMYANDSDRYLPQPSNNGAMSSGVGAVPAGQALWFNAVDYYLEQLKKNYTTGLGANTQRNHVQYKQDTVWLDIPDGGVTVAGTLVLRDNQRTYKMNGSLGFSLGADWKSYRISEINAPERTVLYADGRAYDTPSTTTGSIDTSAASGMGGFSLTPGNMGLRHQDGANVAKLDGSVSLHQNNARQVSAAGYTGWYTETTANQPNWPDVIFDWQNRKF